MSSPSVPGESIGTSRSDRRLVFSLERGSYAIDLRRVAGVEPEHEIRAVPGAPDAVLGLVESRGRILTVIDLPRLLGEGPRAHPPCLVRLAAPWGDVALHVPAIVQIGRCGAAAVDESRLLVPAELIDRLSTVGER